MGLNSLSKYHAWGITLLRLVVGIIFFVHGLQKLLVAGIPGVTGMFEGMGLPAPAIAATVVTLVETLGGLALILGLFTRWAAIPLAITMLVAIVTVHVPHGFFVTGGRNGYEFALTLMVANIALILLGSGALAVDQVLASRRGGSSSLKSVEHGA